MTIFHDTKILNKKIKKYNDNSKLKGGDNSKLSPPCTFKTTTKIYFKRLETF